MEINYKSSRNTQFVMIKHIVDKKLKRLCATSEHFRENMISFSFPSGYVKNLTGTSLVVQWLGFATFTAMGTGSIPGLGINYSKPYSAAKKQNKKISESESEGCVFQVSLPGDSSDTKILQTLLWRSKFLVKEMNSYSTNVIS